LLGEEGAKAVEALLPLLAAFVEPALGGRDGVWIDAAGADTADLFAAHQAALFEHGEVLHDGRQRHGQWFGKFAYGSRAQGEAFNHCPAARVAERLERQIEGGGRLSHNT